MTHDEVDPAATPDETADAESGGEDEVDNDAPDDDLAGDGDVAPDEEAIDDRDDAPDDDDGDAPGEEAIDDGDDAPDDDDGDAPGAEVEYQLDDWSGESRLLLDGLLNNADVAHVWQAGTLVVRAGDEAAVDEIIDDIDLAAVPALDPDAEKVAYEVGGWTDEQRSGLADALGAEGVPYEWDDNGDLVVLEDDEERVEEILDEFELPDALDAGLTEEEDGLAAQQVMSDLFVSADRLMHDARDPDGVLTLVDAAETAASLSLPFGFERGVWDEIVARSRALSDEFERDSEEDDVIVDRATELRNLLRNYV